MLASKEARLTRGARMSRFRIRSVLLSPVSRRANPPADSGLPCRINREAEPPAIGLSGQSSALSPKPARTEALVIALCVAGHYQLAAP